MNHKRGRAKDQRAGCLMCKPHKGNRASKKFVNQTKQEKKSRISEKEQMRE
jgi:hypothetical protein